MGLSSPEVITKIIDNVKNEPFENLTIDIEEIHQGKIMEKLGERKAQLIDMIPDSNGRVRIDYSIASRGLIGFRTEFLTLSMIFVITSGDETPISKPSLLIFSIRTDK